MQFIDYMPIILTILTILLGYGAWQREYRGRRNIELAEETLVLFYEAKDVIEWLRHPIGYSDESSSLVQGARENKEDFEARKRVNFIYYRYNQNKELFNKIHSLRYRFMVQIGKEKVRPFNNLDSLLKEIISSAKYLAMLWPANNFSNEDEAKRHYEEIKKKEKIIWDTFGEDDPINPKVNRIIEDIEKVCGDIIMGQGTLYGILNYSFVKKDI